MATDKAFKQPGHHPINTPLEAEPGARNPSLSLLLTQTEREPAVVQAETLHIGFRPSAATQG